jgi:hypothetical protein
MASSIEPLLTVADLDAFPDDDGDRPAMSPPHRIPQ